MNTNIRRALSIAAHPASNAVGIAAMKIAIAIIFLWIGALKFFPYEADSITPFVATPRSCRYSTSTPQTIRRI